LIGQPFLGRTRGLIFCTSCSARQSASCDGDDEDANTTDTDAATPVSKTAPAEVADLKCNDSESNLLAKELEGTLSRQAGIMLNLNTGGTGGHCTYGGMSSSESSSSLQHLPRQRYRLRRESRGTSANRSHSVLGTAETVTEKQFSGHRSLRESVDAKFSEQSSVNDNGKTLKNPLPKIRNDLFEQESCEFLFPDCKNMKESVDFSDNAISKSGEYNFDDCSPENSSSKLETDHILVTRSSNTGLYDLAQIPVDTAFKSPRLTAKKSRGSFSHRYKPKHRVGDHITTYQRIAAENLSDCSVCEFSVACSKEHNFTKSSDLSSDTACQKAYMDNFQLKTFHKRLPKHSERFQATPNDIRCETSSVIDSRNFETGCIQDDDCGHNKSTNFVPDLPNIRSGSDEDNDMSNIDTQARSVEWMQSGSDHLTDRQGSGHPSNRLDPHSDNYKHLSFSHNRAPHGHRVRQDSPVSVSGNFSRSDVLTNVSSCTEHLPANVSSLQTEELDVVGVNFTAGGSNYIHRAGILPTEGYCIDCDRNCLSKEWHRSNVDIISNSAVATVDEILPTLGSLGIETVERYLAAAGEWEHCSTCSSSSDSEFDYFLERQVGIGTEARGRHCREYNSTFSGNLPEFCRSEKRKTMSKQCIVS